LIVRRAANVNLQKAEGSARAFGAMFQDTPMVLMSRPEHAIRNLADLCGKRVGMHTDGIRALEVILTLEGISVADLDLREVGFDLNHLLDDHVDAVQGYIMTEPVQLAALGVDVDVLPLKHPRLQPYAQIYFSDQSQLETHRDVFASFLSASTAGWLAVCADPDEAAAVVAAMMGDPTQVAPQRAMLNRVVPLVAGGFPTERVGTTNTEQWKQNLRTYFECGLVNRPLALHEVVFNLGSGSHQQLV
jgi:NitT/TauT family transport system substrate-binding protein